MSLKPTSLSYRITRRFVSLVALGAGMCLTGGTLPAADAPAPGKDYTQNIPGTTVNIELKALPAGEIEFAGKDGKVEKAKISPIWIGKFELMWDQYDPWSLKTDLTDEQKKKGVDAAARPSPPYIPPDRGFGHDGFACLHIAYPAAQKYCAWLSARTGHKFRLPTEAEWVYACRAGEPADKKFTADDLKKIAWTKDTADEKTHKCGTLAANAWGLFDTLGNVGEWVTAADGAGVLRGGSFNDDADDVNFNSRAPYKPEWQQADPQEPKSKWWLSDAPFAGFRIVMEP